LTEEEASEKEIDEGLKTIMEAPDNKKFENITSTIKFLTGIIFNLRYDLNELKLKLIEVYKGDEEPISVKEGENNTEELYS